MKKWLFACVLCLSLLSVSTATIWDPPAQTIEAFIDSKLDGLVVVTNATNDGKGGMGTGFFIDDNVILTNHHVIANAREVTIKPRNAEKAYKATVVGSDPVSDVAVLRIDDWDAFKRNVRYAKLSFGDSREVKAGQSVWVLGHPWGLEFTVSKGVVSHPARRPAETPQFFIQTDAHVFQGNSGGPMLNSRGEVIGINSVMISRTGGSFGLAEPTELVLKSVRAIQAKKPVKWPYLGLTLSPTEDGHAVMVTDVSPLGSVTNARADIRPKDVITRFYSRRTPGSGTSVTSLEVLLNGLSVLDEGDVMKLVVLRNGEERLIEVPLLGRDGSIFTLPEPPK